MEHGRYTVERPFRGGLPGLVPLARNPGYHIMGPGFLLVVQASTTAMVVHWIGRLELMPCIPVSLADSDQP